MISLLMQWQRHYGAAHRRKIDTTVLRTGGRLTLHPSQGGVRGDKRMQMYTRLE